MQRLDVDRRRRHELLAEQTVDLGVREVIGQPAVEPPLAPVPLRVLLERALERPQLAVVLAVAAPGPAAQLPRLGRQRSQAVVESLKRVLQRFQPVQP